MRKTYLVFGVTSLLVLSACGAEKETVGINGTLTQIGQAVTTEAECPNGGISLDHGIDKNADGKLGTDEVLNTYVLCHGKDGSDADVGSLEGEVNTLKSVVELNTEKVGITDDEKRAIVVNTGKLGISLDEKTAIAGNTAKVGISTDEKRAIEANTVKVGITAGEKAAIVGNTAKVGITADEKLAIVGNTGKMGISAGEKSAIVVNTAKAGITADEKSAIVVNTAKAGITADEKSAIVVNTAKAGITADEKAAIVVNTAKAGITTDEKAAIVTNTGKVGFPGYSTLDSHISQTWDMADRVRCQGAGGVWGTKDKNTEQCIIDPCNALQLDPWWSNYDVAYEIRFGTCQRAVIAYSGVGAVSTSSCGNCDDYDNETVVIEYAGEMISLSPNVFHGSFEDTRNYHFFDFRAAATGYQSPTGDGSNGRGKQVSIEFQIPHSALAHGKLPLTNVSLYQHSVVKVTTRDCGKVGKSYNSMFGDYWACGYADFTATRVNNLKD